MEMKSILASENYLCGAELSNQEDIDKYSEEDFESDSDSSDDETDNIQYEKLIEKARNLEKFLKSLLRLEGASTSPRLYECPECRFQTVRGRTFVEHFQVHFPGDISDCENFDGFNEGQDGFYDSCLDEVEDRLEESNFCFGESGLLACSLCEYKTNRKWNLSQHTLTHEEIKEGHSCHFCTFKTNIKRRLKLHMQEHLEGRRFECPHCDYKTARRGSLHQHMHVHSKQKRFQCPSCEYKTNRKWSLRKHFKTHSEDEIFSCNDCSFVANNIMKLSEHRKIHHRFSSVDTKNISLPQVDINTDSDV